jgi:hypothetical protein
MHFVSFRFIPLSSPRSFLTYSSSSSSGGVTNAPPEEKYKQKNERGEKERTAR